MHPVVPRYTSLLYIEQACSLPSATPARFTTIVGRALGSGHLRRRRLRAAYLQAGAATPWLPAGYGSGSPNRVLSNKIFRPLGARRVCQPPSATFSMCCFLAKLTEGRSPVACRFVLLHLRVPWLLCLSSQCSSHTRSRRVSAPWRGRCVHCTDTSSVGGTTHPLTALS